MAKIDHAAIRTTSYEDTQKFFEDVFEPANAGIRKESSSARWKPSSQTVRMATTTFPSL